MGMDSIERDPFQHCEAGKCSHDLSVGVLVSDLLDRDGPHPIRPWTAPPPARAPLEEAA